MIDIIAQYVICILAIERCAEIITSSYLFQPIRSCLFNIAANTGSSILLYLHKVLTCGWCLSTQLSIVAAFFLPGEYLSIEPYNNIVFKSFALAGLANFWHSIFQLIHRGRVQYHQIALSVSEADTDDEDQNEDE